MQKLDIHDTARLVRYAIESGLVKIRGASSEVSSSDDGPAISQPRKL
jgi:hypothetical protein